MPIPKRTKVRVAVYRVTINLARPDGSKPRYPRHVFSCPVRGKESLDVILALGAYLFSRKYSDRDIKLFIGRDSSSLHTYGASLSLLITGSQSARFLKHLRMLTKKPAIVEQLQASGMDPSDLGSHSYRKGSSTYVSNASVAGPSIVALQIRAGWTLGNVKERYLHYEKAGDCFVGRSCCGLDPNSVEFGLLPPHFRPFDPIRGESDDIINNCIASSCGGLARRPNMMPILRYLHTHCGVVRNRFIF